MGLQQIQNVLRDAGAVRAVFSDPFPQLEQELRRILMHEQQVDLVDEDEGLLPALPVLRDPVQDRVEDDEHPDGAELLSEVEDVVADQAV